MVLTNRSIGSLAGCVYICVCGKQLNRIEAKEKSKKRGKKKEKYTNSMLNWSQIKSNKIVSL